MEQTNEKIAKEIILENRYLTLSTCHLDNPWITPLAYVIDEDCNFYFYSAIDSVHIKNLSENSRAACSIFDSTKSSDDADGLQFSARVTEISENDLEKILDLYFTQSFPDPQDRARWLRPTSDFSGNSIQRFYCIKPVEMFKVDTASIKVDRRVKIDLNVLRQIINI